MSAHRALVVVDIQNDFCEPTGSLAVPGSTKIIPIVNELLADPVYTVIVLTQDWHPENHISFARSHGIDRKPFTAIETCDGSQQLIWPVHCVQGTEGANLHRELSVPESAKFIKKGCLSNVETMSGFGNLEEQTNLVSLLREANVVAVDIVGLALDYCVRATALDAKLHGFQTRVLLNATRAVISENIQSVKAEFLRNNIEVV